MAYRIKRKLTKDYIPLSDRLESQLDDRANALTIYKIKGKLYFRDKRLGEYRNINDPFIVLKEKDVMITDFEKPTMKERKKLEKRGYL